MKNKRGIAALERRLSEVTPPAKPDYRFGNLESEFRKLLLENLAGDVELVDFGWDEYEQVFSGRLKVCWGSRADLPIVVTLETSTGAVSPTLDGVEKVVARAAALRVQLTQALRAID